MGLSIRFFPETYRLAPIFTTQLLNLVGGVMTPPYDGLPDKSKFGGRLLDWAGVIIFSSVGKLLAIRAHPQYNISMEIPVKE